MHKATHNTMGVLDNLPSQNILLAGFGEDPAIFDKRMLKPNGIQLQLSKKQLHLLPKYYHTVLNAKVGVPSKLHVLTGTIAVAWALRNTRTRPVFVIGFDMAFQNSTSLSYTHADGSVTSVPSLAKYHKVEADARWLRSLEKTGKIVRLDKAGLPSTPPPSFVVERTRAPLKDAR